VDHRGDEIGAGADRLPNQDVRAVGRAQSIGRPREVVEPAAETTAGDLLDREPPRSQIAGIDEIGGLVVGDQTDPQAPFGVTPGELR
jgi:hypothetical protein